MRKMKHKSTDSHELVRYDPSGEFVNICCSVIL